MCAAISYGTTTNECCSHELNSDIQKCDPQQLVVKVTMPS